MKTIYLSNGEIRKGYEYDDLCKDAQNKVIDDTIQFEIETMQEDSPYYHCAIEMEKMQTSWFLPEKIWEDHQNDIIETIKANWIFNEEGNILPLITHTKGNEIVKYTFGKREIECSIK